MSLRISESGARISGSKTANTEYVVDNGGLETLSIHAVYTVAPVTAKTFVAAGVDIVSNQVTSTAHGFATGRKIALTGAGLPTGLTATNYWMIAVDADTLKFAASLVDANAGTAIDLTAIGSGTSTMTPAGLTSCLVKLQESNDASATYLDMVPAVTQAITTTGAMFLNTTSKAALIKIKFEIGDGQVDISTYTCGKSYS
jgi:hypothetical protein